MASDPIAYPYSLYMLTIKLRCVIAIKLQKHHSLTEDRLTYIKNFRYNHEQLQNTIANVLGPDDDSIDDVDGTTAPVVIEETWPTSTLANPSSIRVLHFLLQDADFVHMSQACNYPNKLIKLAKFDF